MVGLCTRGRFRLACVKAGNSGNNRQTVRSSQTQVDFIVAAYQNNLSIGFLLEQVKHMLKPEVTLNST